MSPPKGNRTSLEVMVQRQTLIRSILEPLHLDIQEGTIELLENYEEEMEREFARANFEAFLTFVKHWAIDHPFKDDRGEEDPSA